MSSGDLGSVRRKSLAQTAAGERGSVVFVVAAWLTLTLVMGMSVDYGILMRYRRAMQNACDSAALAGAANLKSDPTTAAGVAERYATQDMTQNNIAAQPAAVTLDSNSQPTLIKPDRVRVDIETAVPTYFYRIVRDSFDVKVECTAKIEPVVSVQGMVPIGLDYTTWWNYYNANIKNGNNGQCDITVPISERPTYCQGMTNLLGVFSAGNNGKLCLPVATDTHCGASAWNSEFTGQTPAGSYCTDPHQVATVPDPNGPACSLAATRTGIATMQVAQAVQTRCGAYPAPPMSQGQIIVMPLLNPAYTTVNGTSTPVQIWGFVAFQLQCPQPLSATQIMGSFVSLVSFQAQGCDPATNQTCVDTGVETVRLVQ